MTSISSLSGATGSSSYDLLNTLEDLVQLFEEIVQQFAGAQSASGEAMPDSMDTSDFDTGEPDSEYGYDNTFMPDDDDSDDSISKVSGSTAPTVTGSPVTGGIFTDTAAQQAGLLAPDASDIVKSDLPSGFQGEQTGIGSWYHASSSTDSTNGTSWVGYPYQNNSPVFAPSLLTMEDGSVAAYGTPEYEKAIKQYAGQQAIVTDKDTGKSMVMYIGDAFDPKWVRSPGSIDLMSGAWSYLSGQAATNKNDVLNVEWHLTGYKSQKYSAGGTGDP